MSLNAYSDVTYSFSFRGEGRDDNYTFRPVSPQSFVAWAPPGALATGSPIYRTHQKYLTGDNDMIDNAMLQNLLPWAPRYVAIVPPPTSTNGKSMKGALTDQDIDLVPNLPNIIAIPDPVPAGWAIYYGLDSDEDLDIYLF